MSQHQPDGLCRIAIVGGGISGLVAAKRLIELSESNDAPIQIDLYEASDRLGGVFGTVEDSGYRIETGADMFITNKPGVLNLVEKLGIENRLIETQSRYRRSFILRKGKPVPTPRGFDLMVPRNIFPLLASPLLSVKGKLRLLYEPFVSSHHGQDETLSQFVIRRFGKEAFDRIVQPMVGGIYTADPDKLSLQATLPRFLEMEKNYGSLLKAVWKTRSGQKKADSNNESASGARYGLFLSFDAGMSVLQNAIINSVQQKVNIERNSPIEKMERDQTGYQLHLHNGQKRSYQKVLLALPAHAASRIVSEVETELSQELGQIEYASAAVVVSGHQLDDISHPMDAFGLVIPAVEKRKILAVSFTSRKFADRAPEGSIQLRTFIGGAMQPEMLEHTDDELTEFAMRELQDIFGVQGDAEITRVVRWNQAMPQYHLGHLQRVTTIRNMLKKIPDLELTGNAYEGVGLPDVIVTAESAAENLWHNK